MIILYCSLVVACVWFGVIQSKRLSSRAKFYYDYLNFLDNYEANLNFRQDNFKDLIKKLLDREKTDFNLFLFGLISEKINSIEYMSKLELDDISSQILSLGNLDSDTESQQVKFLKIHIQDRLKLATSKSKTYGGLSIKISLLIGLLLVVLLL